MALNLVFTVDVDNDGMALANERTSLSWEGISQIPVLKRRLALRGVKVTWFVRADNQLREVYGCSTYVLERYAALWGELRELGDEIAWHPHLNRLSEDSGRYVLDQDEARCVKRMRSTFTELREAGYQFEVVRLGEAFQTNAIMRTLNELGLRIDSSAIPGRRRADSARVFDWTSTPNHPYYPSKGDYRVPGRNDALRILEVPMTTIPVKTSYDAAVVPRYINLSFHHEVLKEGFEEFLRSVDASRAVFVVVILHPEEILGRPPKEAGHPLYSFSLREVERNMDYILNAACRWGGGVRIVTMSQIVGTIPMIGAS